MLNFSPEKLLVLGILALVVLGPNRLPDAARTIGRIVGQLRRMSGSFQSEVRDALAEPRQALQHAVKEFGMEDLRSSVSDLRSSVADGVSSFTSQPASPPPPSEPATTGSATTGPAPAEGTRLPSMTGAAGEPPPPDDPSFN